MGDPDVIVSRETQCGARSPDVIQARQLRGAWCTLPVGHDGWHRDNLLGTKWAEQ